MWLDNHEIMYDIRAHYISDRPQIKCYNVVHVQLTISNPPYCSSQPSGIPIHLTTPHCSGLPRCTTLPDSIFKEVVTLPVVKYICTEVTNKLHPLKKSNVLKKEKEESQTS